MATRIDSSTPRTETAPRLAPAALKTPEKVQQTPPVRNQAQTSPASQTRGTPALFAKDAFEGSIGAGVQRGTATASQTQGTPALFAKDAFESSIGAGVQQEAARMLGLQQSGGTGTVTPATLTSAEMQSAQEAITQAHDSQDAQAVVDWLKANPDPAKQAAFMDLMFQFGPVPGRSSTTRSS